MQDFGGERLTTTILDHSLHLDLFLIYSSKKTEISTKNFGLIYSVLFGTHFLLVEFQVTLLTLNGYEFYDPWAGEEKT